MPRILVYMVFLLAIMLTACGTEAIEPVSEPLQDAAPKIEEPVDGGEQFGKVVLITSAFSNDEEEYDSAQDIAAAYGEENVTHIALSDWPINNQMEHIKTEIINILADIAADLNVKLIVINHAVPGTKAALDLLLEKRDDIFIVARRVQENPPDIAERADLILYENDGYEKWQGVPVQAQKFGAETLIYYAHNFRIPIVHIPSPLDYMRSKSAEIGLEFAYVNVPQPGSSNTSVSDAQNFILEDVPKQIEIYGKDTAFVGGYCYMQVPLIRACIAGGVFSPLQCCPSPYKGFPAALGITGPDGTEESIWDIGRFEMIERTTAILEKQGALGRFSTYLISDVDLLTWVAVDYGVMWINGEVSKEGIDMAALQKCIEAYTGPGAEIEPLEEQGGVLDNFLLISQPYYTYGNPLPPGILEKPVNRLK
jgi:hypothetical protein